DDAERIATGIRTRALRTARNAAVTNVMNSYEDGLLDASGVVERLRPLRLSDDAIHLYLLGSDTSRFRAERRELRAEVIAQGSANIIDEHDAAATMAALGYDLRAQEHTAQVVRLRKLRKVMQEAASETKADVRRAQT